MHAITRHLLTLTLAAATAVTLGSQRPAHAIDPFRVLHGINSARQQYRIAPLAVHGALSQAAVEQARYMWTTDVLSPTGANGSDGGQRIRAAGFNWSAWGECIAWASTTDHPQFLASDDQIVEDWLNGSFNRALILDPHFTHVGVGVWHGLRNGVYKAYWCAVFAR